MMEVSIARWFDNHQCASVLMIDDLSDAYIGVYPESWKNDWGNLCDQPGSAWRFLEEHLLAAFPEIRITFFVPYARHNVVNENAPFETRKYGVGERAEFSAFLRKLAALGHEIAHHGSNHGRYIDPANVSTYRNFVHEWELFDDEEEGIEVTRRGIELFREHAGIDVVGGKYCGYRQRDNSAAIIDACGFEYWCSGVNFLSGDAGVGYFGRHSVLDFPTNFPGNAFVRLSYRTGNLRKDRRKKLTRFLQPFYNIGQYRALDALCDAGEIISVQEHISPATSSGLTQSANIVSDMASLHRLYRHLRGRSVWHANCRDIARYARLRDGTTLVMDDDRLTLRYTGTPLAEACELSLVATDPFELVAGDGRRFGSRTKNGSEVANIPVGCGESRFRVVRRDG